MNENQTAHQIRHYLNQGTALNSRIEARLQSARETALAHLQVVDPGTVGSVAHVIGRSAETSYLFPKIFLPAIALIFGLMAIIALRQNQLVEEIEEIDTAVLAGALPLDAYVDIGFDAWLKRSLQ